MVEFKLPSLGADMDSGKLLEWLVKPGDVVKKGQVVAIVDTSKAAIDVEIWNDGTVQALLVEPGETIPVGTPIATLLAPGETAPAKPKAAAPAGRRKISPAARQEAQKLGIDIDQLVATKADGVVTLDDVRLAATARAQPTAAKPAKPTAPSAMRQTIGAAMSRSKREIPHYYLAETIPLQRALAWLEQSNAKRAIDERLLLAVLQLKAVALTLKRFPDLNGFYRDNAFEPSPGIHLGVAISLRQGGLIAPALHDADQRTLTELMQGLSDLAQRARAGSLRSSEMSDPTITVTNLGDRGSEAVYGVIYPPQVALVGFGRVIERPWVDGGKVRAIPTVVATLSADHRVTDGHRGALFLTALNDQLQHPEDL